MSKRVIYSWSTSCFLACFSTQALSYDVVNRYKLLEDKFRTLEMLSPYGHDFLLGVDVGLNKNLLDVVDEASDASKKNTTNEKIAAASSFLQKYKNTEQTVKAVVDLGFPLPTFHIGDVKFVPDVRMQARVGANVGIRTEALTMATLLKIVDNGNLPADVKTALAGYSIDELITAGQASGNDILEFLANENPNNAAIQQALTQYRGKFVFPTLTSTEVPSMEALVKMEGKAGILTNFSSENLSGAFNLYWMHRTDYYALITQEDIVNKTDFKDKYKNKNTQTFIMTDIKTGYDWDISERFKWNAFGAIEEIKIVRLSDNKAKAGDLRYGVDPLFRVQTGPRFRLGIVGLNTFAGFHKRSGYGLDDGMYLGAEGNVGVFGDRLEVQLRTLFDKEHITLSPRLKLWFMQLEYSLKNPIRSEIDGVKPSALHSLNLRFFI